jgi:WD40 repeat protein
MSGTYGTPPRFSLDGRLLSCDVRDGNLGLWEVAAGGEYRTLLRAAAAGDDSYSILSVRSDGLLLAVATAFGVGLWELPSGKELSFLKIPGTIFVLFEPSSALLTNSAAGPLRCPVQVVSPGSHNGTAAKIWDARSGECKKELPAARGRVGFSPDGRWLTRRTSSPRRSKSIGAR